MKTKSIVITFLFLSVGILHAQSFSAKLENYKKGLPEMDFIIMPFDMNYRVSIGKLKTDGSLDILIPEFSDIQLPSNVKDEDLLKFEDFFSLRCIKISAFQTSETLRGFNGGYFALWRKSKKNQWAGSVFAVSNKDLVPWLEDNSYMQPILASYYELIYVTEDAVINNTCEDKWENSEFVIDIAYEFDLNLKKGFNLIEYQILEIFETNSEEITNKPKKIKVQTPTDFSKIIWTAKYF